MDVLKAVRTYIDRMVSEVSGMKVLLMDAHTTPIVSLAMTQSELLAHEVYLTDRIDNSTRQPLNHLKCICFLRPTGESVEWAKREVRDPKYGEYRLYFSNILAKKYIEELAEADEYEAVQEVQEYFADYLPHYTSLFSMTNAAIADGGPDEPPNPPVYLPSPISIPPSTLSNHVQAILSVLLSLKKRPLIRWERMSAGGKKLAQAVQTALDQPPYRELFGFKPTAGPSPLLLILDRRNDPVTPLLTQWTYQAMVHETVGIKNGRVTVESETRQDLKDLVLSPASDGFFSAQMFSNFGDLGAALQAYVQQYQTRTLSLSNPKSMETLADMKRFVEEYPEFKKLGGNVAKHVSLVGELSKVVERDNLLEVSEVEQSLASNESHSTDLKSVMQLISAPRVPPNNKLRLAILYALRYQKLPSNQIVSVVDHLLQNGISPEKARGVENVYTQHTTHLSQTLDLLLKGRLREASYPFLEGENSTQRPQDIIVFMLGGATYEEARAVALLNNQLAGQTRILLGGTTIHNSTSFLEMMASSAEHFPDTIYQMGSATVSAGAAGATVSTGAASTGQAAGSGPALNLRAGGYELNVGGTAGSGLYRSSANNSGEIGASFQIDGLRDGARNFFSGLVGKVEETVQRVGTPRADS